MDFWRPVVVGGREGDPEQSLSFLNWEMQDINVSPSRGCCKALGCALACSPQNEGSVILPEEG